MSEIQDAKNLKNSSLLKQTLDEHETLLIERWKFSDDPSVRDAAWVAVRQLAELRGELDDKINAVLKAAEAPAEAPAEPLEAAPFLIRQ